MTVHKNHYNLGIAICPGMKVTKFENETKDNLKIDIPHNFKNTTFFGPTHCDHCGKMIWGVHKQGYKCKDCNFNSHGRCRMKFPNNCGLDEKMFTDVMKNLNIDPDKATSLTDIPEKIPNTDPE